MAFVRRTPAKGKKYYYYQWVRNYREDGRHKQEFLAHLGPHPTPEAAIAHHLGWLALYRWKEWRMKADILEQRISDEFTPLGYAGMMHEFLYGSLDDGEIPEQEAAEIALRELRDYAKRYREYDIEKRYEGLDYEPLWANPEWRLPYQEYFLHEKGLWEGEVQGDIRLAQEILAYHRRVEGSAAFRMEHAKMERHRAKLDKLLDVYEKYGGEGK